MLYPNMTSCYIEFIFSNVHAHAYVCECSVCERESVETKRDVETLQLELQAIVESSEMLLRSQPGSLEDQ